MSPSRVRKALTRRLAFLEAALEADKVGPKAKPFYEDERAALRAVLEQRGELVEAQLEQQKAAVRTRVQPIIEQRRERAFRRDESAPALAGVEALAPRANLVEELGELVDAINETVRVA